MPVVTSIFLSDAPRFLPRLSGYVQSRYQTEVRPAFMRRLAALRNAVVAFVAGAVERGCVEIPLTPFHRHPPGPPKPAICVDDDVAVMQRVHEHQFLLPFDFGGFIRNDYYTRVALSDRVCCRFVSDGLIKIVRRRAGLRPPQEKQRFLDLTAPETEATGEAPRLPKTGLPTTPDSGSMQPFLPFGSQLLERWRETAAATGYPLLICTNQCI